MQKDGGELRGAVDDRPVPNFVDHYIRKAEQKLASAADEPPPPPRWPMFTGVFTFPWRLSVLSAWVFISIGLMVTGWLVMFWVGPGLVLGALSARLFGPPACAAALLTFGYAVTCCLTIIEHTSNGWDTVDVAPPLDWKEWTFNFGRIAVLLFEAALVGALFRWLWATDSWTPVAVGTFVAFPLVLLGAMADGEAWAPVDIKPVLWSLRPLWWAWALFYVETGAIIWVWSEVTVTGLHEEPWPTPLYSAPILAAVILIYARLLGRLAGCIVRESAKPKYQGDDDE